MPTKPEPVTRSEAPPGPVYHAVAAALLVLVLGICAVAIERYVSIRNLQRAELAALTERASALAEEVVVGGAIQKPEEQRLQSTMPGAGGRVTIVSAGMTDDFGISRGSQVMLDLHWNDPGVATLAAKSWAKTVMDRSAELASEIEEKREPGLKLTRNLIQQDGKAPLGVIYAPIVSAEKTYLGAVVLAQELTSSYDRTTLWSALIFALIAGLVLFIGVRLNPNGTLIRVLGGLVVGLCAAAPVSGGVPGLWPAIALTGLALGAASLPSFANLLRGLRNQPGTYGYVAPAVVGLLVLVFIPFFMGVGIAFFDKTGDFVGVDHFTEVLIPSDTAQTDFWQTFWVTILWTFSNVVLHVGIGVALALVLNRPDLRFKGLYRVLLILPWAVPNYITALIWRGMFDSTNGAVNALFGAFGMEQVTWLGDGGSFASNFLANLTTNVWLGFPFMMVVTLGALQSIPSSLYEAAEIDGATRPQRFRYVTMPLLKPALVPAVILGTIWTFNMFNVIYLVSRGAPGGDTEILITEAYKAFWILERPGLAAAYALMIFVVLLAYGVITDRITRASSGAFE